MDPLARDAWIGRTRAAARPHRRPPRPTAAPPDFYPALVADLAAALRAYRAHHDLAHAGYVSGHPLAPCPCAACDRAREILGDLEADPGPSAVGTRA